MALFREYLTPRLGIWKLEETVGQLYESLSLKEEYLPFLETIKSERRKQEWLAVRVLLKHLLGEERPIAYRPDGAPYLPDSPLHISISHTDGYVSVLLQQGPSAGVDIESRSDRVKKVRSRFISKNEEITIDSKHEIECLLICWCAKEALFKMIGQTDVDFLQHLHIAPFSYADSGELQVWETRTELHQRFLLRYQLFQDFVLVYSVTDKQ